jgi:hypothetical protein
MQIRNAPPPAHLGGRVEHPDAPQSLSANGQLEARRAPAGEPLIINVQFISAVDESATGGFQARIPQLGPARNSVIKQYR